MPNHPRVFSESPPESFPESCAFPSPFRVFSESSPSRLRAPSESEGFNENDQKGSEGLGPSPSRVSRVLRGGQNMMSKVRKVVLHTLTGYISTGTEDNTPPPLLNPIKTEAKPEVTEPLKQEESHELSKMRNEKQPGSYEALVYADSVEVAREISCGSDPSLACRTLRRTERTGLRRAGCSNHNSAYCLAQSSVFCLSTTAQAPARTAERKNRFAFSPPYAIQFKQAWSREPRPAEGTRLSRPTRPMSRETREVLMQMSGAPLRTSDRRWTPTW
jgi:hypothetical protein